MPISDSTLFGYTFKNGSLLEEALTTPSFRMTTPKATDNQRLEFLGDAVLGLLATDWLYENNPSLKEGELTGKRQHIVSTAALCEAVEGSDFISLLKRNKGAGELSPKSKTVADAVEAVIGAAWLDGGLKAAKTIFDNLSLTANSRFGELDGNPKSALQHLTQAMVPPRMPSYRLVKTTGTSNKPTFTVEVTVEGVGSAQGEGGSRREADSAAAMKLMESL
ncbi:MAG: ribonuclease III [Kiritimatiellae bacterium]|nr:ribonuclease III [Kiritimatiellia bacterium]